MSGSRLFLLSVRCRERSLMHYHLIIPPQLSTLYFRLNLPLSVCELSHFFATGAYVCQWLLNLIRAPLLISSTRNALQDLCTMSTEPWTLQLAEKLPFPPAQQEDKNYHPSIPHRLWPQRAAGHVQRHDILGAK